MSFSLEKNFPILSGEERKKTEEKLKNPGSKRELEFVKSLKNKAFNYLAGAAMLMGVSSSEVKSQTNDAVGDVNLSTLMTKKGKVGVINKDNTVSIFDVKNKKNKLKMKKSDTVELLNNNENTTPKIKDVPKNSPSGLVEYHGPQAPKTIPGAVFKDGKWYVPGGSSNFNPEKIENNRNDKSVIIEGKNYMVFYPSINEHPTDDYGNIKSNYKYHSGEWYKLADGNSQNSNNGGRKAKNPNR